MTEYIPYLLAPSIILVIASILANWMMPGPKVRSALQHLGILEPNWQVSVMAFGAVALLYLVAEELLVEAHEEGETSAGPILLFAGFGAMIVCTMLF